MLMLVCAVNVSQFWATSPTDLLRWTRVSCVCTELRQLRLKLRFIVLFDEKPVSKILSLKLNALQKFSAFLQTWFCRFEMNLNLKHLKKVLN